MARNIKEFTALQVVNYLKHKNEEIRKLRSGIQRCEIALYRTDNSVNECPRCKEWMIDFKGCKKWIQSCAGCVTRMCKDCRDKLGFIYTYTSPQGTGETYKLWFCGECKNSGPRPNT